MTLSIVSLPRIAPHVARELDRLARNAEALATQADTTDERSFFGRGAAAYRRALYFWQRGIRVEPAPLGGYLVPSATRGGLIHRVTAAGCTCEAATRANGACWHSALVVGIEAGVEAAGAEDDGETRADGPGGGTLEDCHEVDTVRGGARSAHPADAGSVAERIARARAARLARAELEECWA